MSRARPETMSSSYWGLIRLRRTHPPFTATTLHTDTVTMKHLVAFSCVEGFLHIAIVSAGVCMCERKRHRDQEA